MKKTVFVYLFSIISLYFNAQSKKDIERIKNLEPVKNLYDTLLHTGVSVSLTQFNGKLTNGYISGKGVKNKEFSYLNLTDTAFVSLVNQSGLNYKDLLRLIKLMSVYKYCSLGVVGKPGDKDYEISIGYEWNKWNTKSFFYVYTYGINANARNNPRYKLVIENVYKGSGITK